MTRWLRNPNGGPMKRLVIGTLVSMAVSGGIASAAAPAPSKPSQIITLFNSGTACGALGSGDTAVDHIVNSDGSSAAFTIPAGQVLIITSIDWTAFTHTANRRFDFQLGSATGNFTIGGGAVSDADFIVSGTLLIPGGLVVKPGVTLCPEVEHSGSSLFEEDSANVRVHGFLAKDK
jgi:hypothetical protein